MSECRDVFGGGGGRGQVVEAKLRAVLPDPWARQGGPENILVEKRPRILFIEYFDSGPETRKPFKYYVAEKFHPRKKHSFFWALP